MKRFMVILPALLLVITMLSGCNQTGSNEKLSVVCTIFPQYDWVRQILGDEADNMDITLLLDDKIDLHNYQPSVDDIVKVSTCDLFIYVGGESDKWVDDALKEAANKDMIIINLMDVLGEAAKTEETIEGMETEKDHSDEEDGEEEAEFDEHVWLSLKNAQIFCPVITDALSLLDAGNAGIYQSNLTVYMETLSALDLEYQTAADAAPFKTLLFGDRFPFRYLVDDYDLNYYAAFAGCSAETEASFETIIFLAGKVDELNLKNIMVTESSDQSIAKTVRNNTVTKDQQILVMDSMQSLSSNDVEKGTTYLSVMADNLDILKEALQ